MNLVLDSSVTMAWIYLDETTEAVRSVFERIAENSAWVPGLWRLEVANVRSLRSGSGQNDGSLCG